MEEHEGRIDRRQQGDNVNHRLHDAAELGQLNLVKKYLSLGDNINKRDPHWKNTPLMYAAMKGHIEVARYLIGTYVNTYINIAIILIITIMQLRIHGYDYTIQSYRKRC